MQDWDNRPYIKDKHNSSTADHARDKHNPSIIKHIKNECGQSTTEYAIIASVFIAIVIAIGLLANRFEDGILIQHAIASASHYIQGSFGGAVDVFCY